MDHFQSPLTREALEYWRSQCQGQAIPRADDYLDRLPPHLAPNLILFDCLPDDMLVRFHGSALITRRGENHTGKSWFSVNSHLPPSAVLADVWAIIRHPCGLWTEATFITSIQRSLRVEAVSLPLAVREGRPPRIVNCSVGLDTMQYDERATGWQGTINLGWVNAGFGVPETEPMR
ncbi:MAG: hypothetical protein EXR11_07025 [Rhodospirillaceae bacterium]|nr:hypothetical protein [Rhodospirillaceae bacterium]